MRILVYAPVHDEPVHDNPLCNKHLQRIARVIKTTWAKGKIGKLEETFSSKRQATRIFVHRKNKSCSLFPTHKQRYPRAYRVISFAVHPPFLRVYIYIQYAYASLDRRNNGIVHARENCNSVVLRCVCTHAQRPSRVIGARHPHESRTGRGRQDRLASETAIVKFTIYSSRK